MKKIVQPVRKVYGASTQATTIQQAQHQLQQPQQQQQQQQSTMQMNAVRKINSLLQSGAVSVTGIPGNQPRMLQKKPLNTQQTSVSITTTNSYVSKQQKCYVCGDSAGINATLLTEASTATSQTEFTSKIAKIVGEGYMVIIGTDDVVCRRCITLFNQMDKLETDLEHVRNTLTSYIHKKYNILDDDPGIAPPPAKIQKLGGTAATTYSIKTVNDSGQEAINSTGKLSELNNSSAMDIETQLSNMFDKPQQIVTQQQIQQQPQQQQHIQTTNNGANIVSSTGQQQGPTTTIRRNPIKMYKCMSCDFKTQDLTQFQPHYEQCKGNAQQQQQVANPTATATTTTSSAYRCKLCKKIFASVALLKQHNALEHQQNVVQQQQQQQQPTELKIMDQQGGGGAGTTITQLYACNMCTYKTPDKQNYDDHLRKHIKLKPFKCRVCLMRFETREQASIHAKNHQPDYFKCGICNVTFNKRELLMKHLETHENVKKHAPVQKHTTITSVQQPQQQQQQQQIIHQQQQPQPQIHIKSEVPIVNQVADSSTQKLLQASIDEALRDTIGETIDAKSIQFHSCNTCSLTFLNEKLYSQHMKMHTGGAAHTPISTINTPTQITTSKKMVNANAAALNNGSGAADQQLHGKLLSTTTTSGSGQTLTTSHSNTISDGDLESIFEKIHSDKSDAVNAAGGGSAAGGEMVITSQDNATGNITYSITLAQGQDGGQGQTTYVQQQQQDGGDNKMILQNQGPIDMPTLDQGDDQQQQQQQAKQDQQQQMNMPVSMPSLDDDGEQSQNSQNSNAAVAEGVPLELEGMQDENGQQIKFILNENGQILQLDNHILTTDAEGNQILVQGADSEHIQQLLQGVGVLMQGGEGLGEGETLQMIGGDGQTGQMILVQGADGQEQLIDASLLNADGNIVIQQSQEGELNAEGTHITTEDGLQIPVSVAFTTSGEVDGEGNLTVAMAGGEGGEQQIQLQLQQTEGDEQQHIEGADGQQHAILTEGGHIILHAQQDQQEKQDEGDDQGHAAATAPATTSNSNSGAGNGSSAAATATTSASGADEQGMFNFDELIQPQVVIKQQVRRD